MLSADVCSGCEMRPGLASLAGKHGFYIRWYCDLWSRCGAGKSNDGMVHQDADPPIGCPRIFEHAVAETLDAKR